MNLESWVHRAIIRFGIWQIDRNLRKAKLFNREAREWVRVVKEHEIALGWRIEP